MERLNEIMGRSIHKRSQIVDQRTNSPRPTGPQGPQRPPAPGQRRPSLPEQTARQGQQHSPNYPVQGQSRPLPAQSQYSGRIQNNQQSLPAPRANYPLARNGAPDSGSNHYRQPSTYRETPAYPAPTSGDYYEMDAYSEAPPMNSDVLDPWEEDEATMRYGDWEEVEDEAPIYSRPPRNDYLPSTDDITATREISIMPGGEARSPLTRLLRGQLQPPMQQIQSPMQQMQSAPQRPPTPLRNQRPYGHQRVTQPLSPDALSGLNREGEMLPTQRPLSRPPLVERGRFAPATTSPTALTSTQVQPPTSPAPIQASVCKICKGAGYLRADVPFGHPNFGKPIACECKEAEKAEKRRQQLRQISNMHAFREQSFGTFNGRVPGVQEAYAAAQEYASDPDGWLVMIGRNGCGKTHLAAAIANQRLEKGSLVLFTTVPDLLDHLRATFAPNSEVVYDQLFSNMREAELLVLDDLGSEQSSSWASEKLFQLLNYRYNLRFPTVITTNNIRLQSVDERIRSRLMDTSMVTSVTLDRAQDYRPHNPRR